MMTVSMKIETQRLWSRWRGIYSPNFNMTSNKIRKIKVLHGSAIISTSFLLCLIVFFIAMFQNCGENIISFLAVLPSPTTSSG